MSKKKQVVFVGLSGGVDPSSRAKLATGQAPLVFVGLSGGVDSAVSAALLKKQGYDVVGVFIRTWHPDFLECNEEEERRDAMRVAAHLDIPFLTFDLEKEYKKGVADYMIAEYKAGRTPNPDVMCNKEVKFGAFFKKAISMGADYVATGHYARVARVESRKLKVKSKNSVLSTFNFQLSTGCDNAKDQSYFLWTLKQEQLGRILFPIGHLQKKEVRKLAQKFDLPVARKKDSQGICFLGAVDLKEFLKHYIKEKKGDVVLVSSESGGDKNNVIGYHDGATFFTLGERHGFTILKKNPNDKPYYIVGKDIKKNVLTVTQNKELCVRQDLTQKIKSLNHNLSHSNILTNIRIKNTNWISEIPNPDRKYTAQIRYHGKFLPCFVICGSRTSAGDKVGHGRRGSPTSADSSADCAEVVFDEPVLVASGQSCVIYKEDVCLGGGVVV